MDIGSRTVVYGNVAPNLKVGDDSVVVGPTDNQGNVSLTGTMALGAYAKAGGSSISVGYKAGAASEAPSLEEIKELLYSLIEAAVQQKNSVSLLELHELSAELDKENPDVSILRKCWAGVESFATAVGAYEGVIQMGEFLKLFQQP